MNEIDPILQRYPTDCGPFNVEPLGSAGGMSGAQFWRIAAPRGTLALRRWPTEHPAPEHLRLIHAVLKHAANRGISILPLPIATRTGESFVDHTGQLWELTPWLPGSADYDHSPSVEKLRAALTALAQFHIAVADFSAPAIIAAAPPVAGAPPAVTRRLARLSELAESGINVLSRAITDTTWPDIAPLARQFLATLPLSVPRAIAQLEPLANVPLPLQPCIRDIWHDHVLFTGERVTGLIDFGAVDIDTPATDLARLLGSLSYSPLPSEERLAEGQSDSPPHFGEGLGEGWREGLAAYTALRPLSPEESLTVFALDTASTLLAGCNWLRWLYVEHRQFENPARVIERFRRITARVSSLQPRSGEIT